MTIRLGLALALLALGGTVHAANDRTMQPVTVFHGESERLDVLAMHPKPVTRENSQIVENEMEQLWEELTPIVPPNEQLAPFVQTSAPTPAALVAGVSFEGPGTGLAGFSLTGAPPDTTMAVGPNHIVAWVNSQYAIFNKTGTLLMAPTNGNALFSGVGNVCDTTNRGDPILQYDRLADRWILSQFAFASGPAAPYLQCFAVSTTNNPMGTYFRYSVTFSPTSPSGFNDYGKLGVWPDGYYTAFNIFGGSPAGGNTGAGLCVSDRVKMLAGDPTATTLCAPINFYGGGGGFLPADLDGTTLPSTTAQGGLFIRQSTAPALRILKLKPNFTAGTVTLTDGFGGALGSFVDLPLPATTRSCNGGGGACIAQPGTPNVLDTLGDRLMYRAAFRNRGGVESLLVAQSVDPDGAGTRGSALRWYEIRNPLGNPADVVVANRPTIFQNGTFDPGATGDRWMGSVAMDGNGNIAAGYSIANSATGLKPSLAIAGREPADAANTLQAEIIALTGTGSQTGTLTRWGDYSTLQVDPSDDRTFWYIGEYLSADGSFNWRTRIFSYAFPVTTATLSINDVSVTEGNAGTTNATFTITRSNNTAAASVVVNTANGTATAGSDFTAITSQTVNFTAGGALTATVTVPVSGDTTVEANETYTVNLSSPSGATISDASGAGTINNDDSATIAINDVTLAEGNAGTTAFNFTVTLTGSVQGGFTVPFSTANGTATQPGDYANTSGTLTFAGTAGETQVATINVVGETILEANETFTVTLGTPSNANVTASDGTGLGTITNDDSASIAVNDVTLAEGNSGTTAFVFTATLTGAVQGGFTVPFSTSNGTATQPADYASASGTLTFAGTAGETQTFTVNVVGETTVEPNETFNVALGTPSNAAVTVSDGAGVGTINNDDGASLTIADRTLTEGNAGTTAFTFTVTLTGNVAGGFTVPFSTSDGTATQPGDYANTSGTLTFAGTTGETQTVTVNVVGETLVEANETFNVALGTPSNGAVTLADGNAVGTITNDDNASIAIGDRTLAEGNAGTTAYTFTVTLTGAVAGGFTVPFSTTNGTATQPGDYANTSGTLTFAGTAGETQTATVNVVGETLVEADETFTVTLGTPSNAGVTVSDGSGLGTITNDDTATIAIGDRTLAEGNAGTTAFSFTVTLTGTVQGGFQVPFSTSNGTATQPGDYANTSGTLTFAGTAGETQTATVNVVGETIVEANETFTVNLGTPTFAAVTASDGSGLGTITNDDAATIAIADRTLTEGNAATTAFGFTVTLTGAVQGGFTVPFSTSNGTATQPGDYANTSGTLTFAGTAGETQVATVNVVGETLVEANETFNVTLGTPSNAGVTASDGAAVGTITNDDAATVSINRIALAEGNAATTAFTFTATLSNAVAGGVVVPFATSNGTATQPGDYASASGNLTFTGNAGETQVVTVNVVGDTVVEPTEAFSVVLSAPTTGGPGVTIGTGTGVGTINNDDAATIAIGNRTLAEGNAGSTAFSFTVTLTGTVQGGFSVPFSTADGTASQPLDYASTSGNAVFAGTNGETQAIIVQVVGDVLPEGNETFVVNLGSPSVAGVTASTAQGTGTITNDDIVADVSVTVTDGRTSIPEGQATTYVVTIANTSLLIDVPAVTVAQSVTTGLANVAWTCVGSGGATCPASGTGVLGPVLALPRNSSVVFSVTADVALGAPTPVATTVTATLQAPASDPNTANNTATDSDIVQPDGLFSNGYE